MSAWLDYSRNTPTGKNVYIRYVQVAYIDPKFYHIRRGKTLWFFFWNYLNICVALILTNGIMISTFSKMFYFWQWFWISGFDAVWINEQSMFLRHKKSDALINSLLTNAQKTESCHNANFVVTDGTIGCLMIIYGDYGATSGAKGGNMMTSWNGNISPMNSPIKASDVELWCFLGSAPE